MTLSLSSIPSRAYIFGQFKENDRTHATSDVFTRIEKIEINFNGVSGVISSANEWKLWRMSNNNQNSDERKFRHEGKMLQISSTVMHTLEMWLLPLVCSL